MFLKDEPRMYFVDKAERQDIIRWMQSWDFKAVTLILKCWNGFLFLQRQKQRKGTESSQSQGKGASWGPVTGAARPGLPVFLRLLPEPTS